MRIATWNVNSMNVRLPRVVDWLSTMQPDVLCLQETKQTDEKFPFAALDEVGYAAVHHGEGRWNGVAILSRVGLEDVEVGFDAPEDEQGARLIAATCAGVRVMSCYVPHARLLAIVTSERTRISLSMLSSSRRLRRVLSLPYLGLLVSLTLRVAPWPIDLLKLMLLLLDLR